MSPTKYNTPPAEDCLEAAYWRGINNDHACTSVLLSQQQYSPLNPSPHLSYPQEPHLNHRLTLLITVEDIFVRLRGSAGRPQGEDVIAVGQRRIACSSRVKRF